MSSYRLLVCLAILGWSERELARRADRQQTTIVRWIKGLSPVPGEMATWLETLVAFHIANPAPRYVAGGGQAKSNMQPVTGYKDAEPTEIEDGLSSKVYL